MDLEGDLNELIPFSNQTLTELWRTLYDNQCHNNDYYIFLLFEVFVVDKFNKLESMDMYELLEFRTRTGCNFELTFNRFSYLAHA